MAPGAISCSPAVAIRNAWHDRFLFVGNAVNHIELLKLCHAFLRGAEINEPDRCQTIDRDTLARLINLYLNEHHALHPAEIHLGSGS